MLVPDQPLLTERLLLRPPTVADAAAIAVYKSRADVTRFVPHGPLSVDQIAERAAAARHRLDDEGQWLGLLAFTRDTGALVGDIVLFWRDRTQRLGEIGYILDPAHGGRGYATEAARAGLALGFDGLGLHRMIGRIDARNTPSARVLERLGMRREAHFVANTPERDGGWSDEVVYALLEDEWRAGATGTQALRPAPR